MLTWLCGANLVTRESGVVSGEVVLGAWLRVMEYVDKGSKDGRLSDHLHCWAGLSRY